MQFAIVKGQCTATIKDSTLNGRRLTLVQEATPEGEETGLVEVALDGTGAAAGQLVLVARGSAARQVPENRQIVADLAIVAIVDQVTT